MDDSIVIRRIQKADELQLAKIIRGSLEEFGAARPGTVYFDPTTDHLFDVFKASRSAYFVATKNNEVMGGAGIYPTANLPGDTCELVKLYLSPVARGIGLGRVLIKTCEEAALAENFKRVYLETMPELKIAIPLYEKLGYKYLDHSLGESGHTGCGIWMIKQLENRLP